jgi:cell division inhibitor SulA
MRASPTPVEVPSRSTLASPTLMPARSAALRVIEVRVAPVSMMASILVPLISMMRRGSRWLVWVPPNGISSASGFQYAR